MYKSLVRPIIDCEAHVISCKHYYFNKRKCARLEEHTAMIKKLESLQNKIPKILIRCPKSTPTAVVRLITGTMPIAGRIDMLKLKLHHSGERTSSRKV